ncbi:MAG TPA: hypothetical protein VIU16_12455 [Gaiellaceae bacterium]
MGSKASRADGEWLAFGQLSENSGVCKAAISTTQASVQLVEGDYLVFVQGTATSASDVCVLKWGADNTTAAAIPTDIVDDAAGTMTANSAAFPCTATERIKVLASVGSTTAKTFVSFILTSGGTTSKIWFVRV